MPQGAPAAAVAAAAERERFPRHETSSRLGGDGLRTSRRAQYGSVVCVRDIRLTDDPAPAGEPRASGPSERAESVLASTGIVPTRASHIQRKALAGESLAAALTSYCEDADL